MSETSREDPEAAVRRLMDEGRPGEAASLALETYGPELLGFLVATLRDGEEAREVFARFCEDLWVGLPGFEWRASLRTWAYTLARHASIRWRADPFHARGVPLSAAPEVAALEARLRTQTLPHLRTQVKDAFAELRAELPEEDRVLLVLRVDRELPFPEIAAITLGDADEAALRREAARLRKRFQLVKDTLREQARARGLLE